MPEPLTSLVILCCNEADCTRLCLEGVLRHTTPPYELVLVDNGSTDATPALLEGFRHRPGPERVEVIHNDTNLGYPAGCNQALRRARGEYVVLLNNDVVVTPVWLDGLLRTARGEGAGLVGPVSNYASPPQLVPAAYADLASLDAFALGRHREYAGGVLRVPRLTGFCLLVEREVFERVGLLDERFGPGFFDDDDLCLRAARAGFRMAVALDVYVHHFGSRTFSTLGLDPHRLLAENLARFRDKWGPEAAAAYRLPAPAAPQSLPAHQTPILVSPGPTDVSSRARVSLCLIVRDEEANLPDCLGPVRGLFDEVVVVDTGSADRTREVAEGLGARVYESAWRDSFAEARNASLDHATGEWVFWLDADDRLDNDNIEKLRDLLARLGGEKVGYLMRVLCPPAPGEGSEIAGDSSTAVDHLRLFPNLPGLRWRYRVHEQILLPLRKLGVPARASNVVIRHTGYQDPALRARKLQRDLRLLRLDAAEHPDDPYVLFNLGWVHLQQGHAAEAVALLERARLLAPAEFSIIAKLHALLAHARLRLGQHAEALRACHEGRERRPADPELLFLEGVLLHQTGDHAGAEASLLRLLGSPARGQANSLDLGLWGHKARHNLAQVYRALRRPEDEERQWRAALQAAPGNGLSFLGLGELYLRQGREAELEQLLGEMRACPGLAAEVVMLEAQRLLKRRAWADARVLLEGAFPRHPRVTGLRVLLAQALDRLGQRGPAERLLDEVLAAEPANPAARKVLGRIRSR
jgi:GT2 family glycosyltransferase/tetratricopeptide (TPR) repeat protein